MERLILLCFTYAFCYAAVAQTTLTVEVYLKDTNTVGNLRAALCDNDESFHTDSGCIFKEVKAEGEMVVLKYIDLVPGNYAFEVFQDVNGDKKLNANVIGIPSEPFGFSNDAMGKMGPASFEQASFKVGKEPITIKVHLKGR